MEIRWLLVGVSERFVSYANAWKYIKNSRGNSLFLISIHFPLNMMNMHTIFRLRMQSTSAMNNAKHTLTYGVQTFQGKTMKKFFFV